MQIRDSIYCDVEEILRKIQNKIKSHQNKVTRTNICKTSLSVKSKRKIVVELSKDIGLSEKICAIYLENNNYDIKKTLYDIEQSLKLEQLKANLLKNSDIIQSSLEKNINSEQVERNISECSAISKDMHIKRIGIFATMSAGKSTLINALVGDNLCPSQNQACTAKILKFIQCDEIKSSFYINESENIPLNLELLGNLNHSSDNSLIEVLVNFQGIKNKEREIIIFDTPGVNYSQDLSHGELSYKFLSEQEFDQIIYVMNSTQFGVDDDKALLMQLKEKLKSTKTDMVFLMDKIDQFDLEFGESIQEAVDNCKNYLEETGFSNPKIIPISAYAAKLIRMRLNNYSLSRKEVIDLSIFMEMFQEKDYFLPQYAQNITRHYNRTMQGYGTFRIGSECYSMSQLLQVIDATGVLMLEQLINR